MYFFISEKKCGRRLLWAVTVIPLGYLVKDLVLVRPAEVVDRVSVGEQPRGLRQVDGRLLLVPRQHPRNDARRLQRRDRLANILLFRTIKWHKNRVSSSFFYLLVVCPRCRWRRRPPSRSQGRSRHCGLSQSGSEDKNLKLSQDVHKVRVQRPQLCKSNFQ